jgi:hypothetical protein
MRRGFFVQAKSRVKACSSPAALSASLSPHDENRLIAVRETSYKSVVYDLNFAKSRIGPMAVTGLEFS